jgi:hypothetical protein
MFTKIASNPTVAFDCSSLAFKYPLTRNVSAAAMLMIAALVGPTTRPTAFSGCRHHGGGTICCSVRMSTP